MYSKQSQLLELDPASQRALIEQVHVRPKRWPDDIERLHELLPAFGGGALRAALEQLDGRPGLDVSPVGRDLDGLALLFETRHREERP